MTQKTCVVFLIPSLVAHGAERQLCELVREMDETRFDIHVVVFYDPDQYEGGDLSPEIAALPHVSLHSLHKRRGAWGNLTALPKLLALIHRIGPDVLHGYMDGNIPVLLVGKLLRKRVVWGIRRTSSDMSRVTGMSLRLLRLTVRLSRSVDLIIFNSEAGRLNHAAMGMRAGRMHVIPNGFDVLRFSPDPALGSAQRKAWGVPDSAPLIGIVGRLNPVKDHPTFLRAAARVAEQWPEARFVCVGGGPSEYASTLKALGQELGLGDRVIWSGVCEEMPAAYNALSALVLSSTDEGFPNVVGEAMSCGVPCVVTRAGDAEILVGDTGFVVDLGDDAGIAAGLSTLLREPEEARARRAAACRTHITTTYSAGALARATEQALLDLLPSPAAATLPIGG